MILLKNWSVMEDRDPYKAPELRKTRLSGEAYGHPWHEDGTRVVTSSISKTSGRRVHTRSGSTYILCEMHPEYRKFLEREGIEVDEDNPIQEK